MSRQRQIFIKSLFQQLQNESYILLKFIEADLDSIDEHSDLDILLPSRKSYLLEDFIQSQSSVVQSEKITRSSMNQYFIFFEDGGFLQVDLLFKLLRKHLIYMETKTLISQSIQLDGVKTYTPELLFEHLVLFNFLNDAEVPAKYIQYFQQLDEATQARTLAYIKERHALNWDKFEAAAQFNAEVKQQLIHSAEKLASNRFDKRIVNIILYLWDSIKNLFEHRGRTITFSGVDGAGKSTIIEATKKLLSEKYRRKVVVLRHRPSVLPILSAWKYGKDAAEARSVARLPRTGNNSSKWKSIFRFTYYYSDYLLGHLYVFVKYILRGYIVLYDRYYFDFIADGKRSNIAMNTSLPKSLYRFIYKPDLNLFLYASPETILSRKKELDEATIIDLTQRYQNLFKEFSSDYKQTYLPIENNDKEATIATIIQQYQKIA